MEQFKYILKKSDRLEFLLKKKKPLMMQTALTEANKFMDIMEMLGKHFHDSTIAYCFF